MRLKILLTILGLLILGSGSYLATNTILKPKLPKPTEFIGFDKLKKEATDSAKTKDSEPKKEAANGDVKGATQYTNSQPTPVTSQTNQTVDPNIKIELCKTRKQQEIDRYMQIGLDTYKKEKPDVYALANAPNKGETETLALQYAYITQSQVVHYADYFQKLLSEGVPMQYAQTQAQAAGDAYYAYLTNLHNWAKNQFDSYTATAQSKANDYGNEVYTGCLKT